MKIIVEPENDEELSRLREQCDRDTLEWGGVYCFGMCGWTVFEAVQHDTFVHVHCNQDTRLRLFGSASQLAEFIRTF